jgi:hypothetical protein
VTLAFNLQKKADFGFMMQGSARAYLSGVWFSKFRSIGGIMAMFPFCYDVQVANKWMPLLEDSLVKLL